MVYIKIHLLLIIHLKHFVSADSITTLITEWSTCITLLETEIWEERKILVNLRNPNAQYQVFTHYHTYNHLLITYSL